MRSIGAFGLKWSLRAVALGVVAMFVLVMVLTTLGAALLVANAVSDPRGISSRRTVEPHAGKGGVLVGREHRKDADEVAS